MRDSTRYKKVYPYLRQDPKFVPTSAFLSGEIEPEVSIGSVGDFYIKIQGPEAPPPEENSLFIYGPKTQSGWPSPIQLVGEAGPKGDQGEAGPKGDQGEAGPKPWNYLGNYDNGYSYAVNDAVSYGGGFYVRYSDPSNPGYPPPDPVRWYTVASPGAQGAQGEIGPAGPSFDGKTGNTIFVTKQSDGAYSSLQDAINQSVVGDTILVGAGNWGDITLKGGINIVGLQPPVGDKVVVSRILFSSSTDAATNTVFISNIRVSNNNDISQADIESLSGAGLRVSFSGCRFYRNNSTSNIYPLIRFSSALGDTTSSIYLENCIISTEGNQYLANLVESSIRYLDLNSCKFWNGAKALKVSGGSVAVSNSRFETNYLGPSISLESSGTGLTLGESLVRNLGGVSSKGIQLSAGTVCAVSNTVFDISSNSGTSCIDGPLGSICYYGNITAVTPQPNPSTGMPTEQRSTNISGALTKIPFTQVS